MFGAGTAHRRQAAYHETCHAAYGTATGCQVEWLALSPTPRTTLHCGVSLAGLGLQWRRHPAMALWHVTTLVGVLLAPCVITHEPLAGSPDQEHLHLWQHAWDALSGTRGSERPLPWADLVRLAWTDVEHWSTRPGATAALAYLTTAVARAGFCSDRTWAALWHSTQARPLWSDIRT